MYLENLKLSNFRNYETLDMNLNKGYNVIYGNNAQGKTNIIEAIFFCAAARSHRTSRDSELVRNGENGFGIRASLNTAVNDYDIDIRYVKNEKKKIRINEIPVKKIGELIGHLNAVIFSPEDLFIVKEGPSVRRRYIDITLSQLRPSYFYDLQQYNKVLFQRNILLKEIGAGKSSTSTLDVWTHQLIEVGSKIIKRRQDFLYELGEKARERHFKLTNDAEELKISYQPAFRIPSGCKLSDIETIFQRELKKVEKRELYKCSTQLGPQRDDFDIHLNGLNTKQFGSQGQQRTSVLSLKLAEIDILFDEKQDYPILLLDDVLSELDENRQEYLYENIGQVQTLITCTDIKKFNDDNKNTSYYNIIAGHCLINNNK